MATYQQFLNDQVSFIDSITSLPHSGHIVDKFDFFDNVSAICSHQFVRSRLDLFSGINIKRVIHTSVTTKISFATQQSRNTYIQHIQHVIPFRLEIIRKTDKVISLIPLVQTIQSSRSTGVNGILDLVDTPNRQMIYNRNIISLLELGSGATNETLRCGVFNIQVPNIIIQNDIVLSRTDMGLSYTFRAPEYGNTDRREFTRILRFNRHNDPSMFFLTTWPRKRVFEYNIFVLKRKEIDQFQYFIDRTLGLEIALRDYENRVWVGVITTPSNDIIQPARSGYNISFQFDGHQVG